MADDDDKRSPEDKRGAVVTALGETLARSLSVAKAVEGKQFSLFDPEQPLPDDAAPAEVSRGRGRPPGARNKATEELRAFVRAKYGDPGLLLLQRIFADPKVLASALGAPSAWDVQVKQMEWAMRMVPFFWAAMPAELKVQAKGFLAMAVSAAPGALQPGDKVVDADPFAALLEMAQNQGLSQSGAGLSNDDQSNDALVIIDGSKA